MKILTLAISIILLPSYVFAGGPNAEVRAQVNGVEVGEDFITFAVYGEALLFVQKTKKEQKDDPEAGNAKWVPLRFENRFIVIRRPIDPVPGFSQEWEQLKEEALKLKEKKAFFQLWGTKTTIENATITRIDATTAKFREDNQSR